MAAASPVRPIVLDCFVCLSSGISTSFKLFNKACSEDHLFAKLVSLFGSEYTDSFNRSDFLICRNCRTKVNRFYDFKINAINSFLAGTGGRLKRLNNTSPSIIKDEELCEKFSHRASKKVRHIIEECEEDPLFVSSGCTVAAGSSIGLSTPVSAVSSPAESPTVAARSSPTASPPTASPPTASPPTASPSESPTLAGSSSPTSSTTLSSSVGPVLSSPIRFDRHFAKYTAWSLMSSPPMSLSSDDEINDVAGDFSSFQIDDSLGPSNLLPPKFSTEHGYSLPSVVKERDDTKNLTHRALDAVHSTHDLTKTYFKKSSQKGDTEDRPGGHSEESDSLSSLLLQVQTECGNLQSRGKPSILFKMKSITSLSELADDFFNEILMEMKQRAPTLFHVLVSAAGSWLNKTDSSVIPAICAAYSILMKTRDTHLSGFQRLVTLTLMQGHCDDKSQQRLSGMGICMHPSSKRTILQEAKEEQHLALKTQLLANSIPKIIGDNLDIYVRSKKGPKDLHMFSSLFLFPRLPYKHMHLSTEPPQRVLPGIHDFVLEEERQDQLLSSYAVLVSRILAQDEQFAWMEKYTSKHIPHQYEDYMAQKSKVIPISIQDKNEAKYEDCIDICDSYERVLVDLHRETFGNLEKLDKNKVIVGGDQLTRKRLSDCKSLRALAEDPIQRFEHLNPIVIELWHMKQDFLEKAYKLFFKPSRSAISLRALKVRLKKGEVNGNVKSNFQAHADFFVLVTKVLITAQAKAFFDNQLHEPPNDQQEYILMNIKKMLQHYRYLSFNLFTEDPPAPEEIVVQTLEMHRLPGGIAVLIPKTNLVSPTDDSYEYCNALCQWGLHFISLCDMAHEGDLSRIIPNIQTNIPFFFQHSKLSKYFVESLILLYQLQYQASPQMQLRIMEGAFVNTRGGPGNNVEADLKMEHSVRNRKDLIRSLGANKTLQAMQNVCGAADAIVKINHNVDAALAQHIRSGKHSNVKEAKIESLITVIEKEAPFLYTPGRNVQGYSKFKNPLNTINKQEMKMKMMINLGRVALGGAGANNQNQEDDFLEIDGVPDEF